MWLLVKKFTSTEGEIQDGDEPVRVYDVEEVEVIDRKYAEVE